MVIFILGKRLEAYLVFCRVCFESVSLGYYIVIGLEFVFKISIGYNIREEVNESVVK